MCEDLDKRRFQLFIPVREIGNCPVSSFPPDEGGDVNAIVSGITEVQ